MPSGQLSLFAEAPEMEAVKKEILRILDKNAQPSAWELLEILEDKLGLKVRWAMNDAMHQLAYDSKLTNFQKDYIRDLIDSEDFVKAIRGSERPAREIESTVDALIHNSATYRHSEAFQEMINFMAKFRDYAPFNNMLVKLQNPSCSFFATRSDWNYRFCRQIKEDARPLLILAPMHPVMLVYDLDSTEGKELPESILKFATFEGYWDTKRLSRIWNNAETRDMIRIKPVKLSSTNAGFATIARGSDGMKMRIGIHNELDEPSMYGVLLHELAHIYLGHLGGDKDRWWPSRIDLSLRAMEVEAEAVAFIVSQRAGLQGTSHEYISGYLDGEATLKTISLDLIAKVAGRLEEMSLRKLGKRRAVRPIGSSTMGNRLINVK